MEIVDVVRKLIGPIEPVGETYSDEERLENIKTMTALVDELLHDLNEVAGYRVCHEYSKKKAGEYARSFLQNIRRDYGQ